MLIPVHHLRIFFQVGFGSGFGNRKGFLVKTGVSTPDFRYVGAEIPLKNLLLEGMYYFPMHNGELYPYKLTHWQFSVKLRIN